MRNRWIFIIAMMLTLVLPTKAANHRFTLVIDPGHGGHDAGAVGAISKEKNINLKVALAFGRMVERNCPDVKVVYTRKTDVFIPLNERANIANKAKADLFISVHTNALPKGRIARGFEVYTLGMHRAADNLAVAKRENSVILVEKDYKQVYQGFDPNSSESYIMFEFIQDKNMAKSVELAKMVQQEVCAQANRPNKGVHQAGFLVLRATSMPSCLIELGFITTSDEEQLLNSERGIENHARGIYRAFNRYKQKYDDNIVVPYNAPKKKEKVEIPTIVPPEIKEESQPKTKPQPQVEEKVPENAIVAEASPAPEPVQSEVEPLPVEEAKVAPVFKVQILATDYQLKKNDSQLKGEKDVDLYQEKGWFKYTIGASSDYQEINQLRKTLQAKFPQAFIVAFKNGAKMDVREAIQEYKKMSGKK
jgi:N-acetylmuramoyl-L-alanine amidase